MIGVTVLIAVGSSSIAGPFVGCEIWKAVLTAVGSSSIAGPFVGNEVGKVVLHGVAGGCGVAPVVHLATPSQKS